MSASECEQLEAEMHRVAAHHAQQVAWWENHVYRSFVNLPEYYDGANAHAFRQVSLYQSLQEQYSLLWKAMRGLRGGRDGVRFDAFSASGQPSESPASPTLTGSASVENCLGAPWEEEIELTEL